MSSTLLKSSALRTALRSTTTSTTKRAALASTIFTRNKVTLPDLPCTQEACIPVRSLRVYKADKTFRRLWRPRTSHLRQNHGTASQQAPPDIREQLQCSAREDGRDRGQGRCCGTDRTAAFDQLSRRYVYIYYAFCERAQGAKG